MHNQSEEKNSESMFIPGKADFVGKGILLSNETWEHIIDDSQGLIALISPDYRILRITRAMATMLGGEPTQFEGKLCFQVFHGSDSPSPDCPIGKIKDSQATITSIVDDLRMGKTLVKAIPLNYSDGQFAGYLHYVQPLEGKASITRSAEMENALVSLVNAMPGAAILCDQNGKIQISSSGFIEMTGITDFKTLAGSSFISFLAYDDIEKALLNFNSVVFGSKSRATDHFMVRRSGRETLRSEVTMTPYHDEGQTITGVLLTFRDVSTELEMEESANKNHLRLSRFNKTFVGFSSDPAININRLIAVLGEMLGASCCSYSRFENGKTISSASWKSPFLTDFDPGLTEKILADRLITEKVDFLFLPKPHLLTYFADNPLLQEKFGIKTLLGVAVRSGNRLSGFIALSFTFNYSFKSDDREFVSLVSSALALEDSRTMLTGASVVDDLNYRELFNFFTDAIYIMSPDGNFLDVNSGAIKMDGYSKEEIIGQTFEKLSAPGKNDLDAAKEAINKAFQGESLSIDWWGQRKSGEVFPKNLVLNRGRYFGESVVIAIGRDITERKLVEEKLIQYNQELKEINQSKDKFFSILAHDLKNPFGGLLGFIDLLYEDIDDLSSDQVKEYLQNIRTASYHTYSLLENLLEWSRIQTGKVPFRPSFFDLGEEINSVLMVLEANAVRKNVKLVNLVGEGITAEADRNMIHSVIQNLVANAIKFSNSNCEVTIAGKLSLKGKDEPANDEMTQSRINWYELRITDTGVGIPDEIMPKLFRLDGQFSMAGTANEPGTGLGLILCKEMVEKNGGKIWADSVAGKGSTFSFTLPLKG